MRTWAKISLAVVAIFLVLVVVAAIIIHRQQTRKAVPLPAPFPLPTSGPLQPAEIVFDSDRSGSYEIYSMTTAGTDVVRLTNDPSFDSWWPQLTPDREHVIFYRTPKGVHDNDSSKNSLWITDVHGQHAEQLLPSGAYGWVVQGHAMVSPDGQHLVMFAGGKLSPQIWVTDLDGHNARRLTERGGVNIDPSYSPDGKTVAFVGCPHAICFAHNYEVFTLDIATGQATRVTSDDLRDQDPVYSPDGAWLAWLTETSTSPAAGIWNIRKSHPDGSALSNVTNDENINSRPAFTPDGTQIYFHRLVYGAGDSTFQIWQIAPDGTGLREVTSSQPGNNEYPTLGER